MNINNYFLAPSSELAPSLAVAFDFPLVFLSLMIASLSAYSLVQVSQTLSTDKVFGSSKIILLCTSSVVVGAGFWAMHFISLLAISFPIQVNFDVDHAFFSAIPAIFAAAIALRALSADEVTAKLLHFSGFAVGVGVCMMHYLGMAGLVMDAVIRFDPLITTASVIAAYLFATMSLWIIFELSRINILNESEAKIVSAFAMGCALIAIHYSGMAASFFSPTKSFPTQVNNIDSAWLAGLVFGVSSSIQGLLIAFAAVYKRLKMTDEARIAIQATVDYFLESTWGAVCSIDQEGAIKNANGEAARLLGYGRNEMIGRLWTEFARPDPIDEGETQPYQSPVSTLTRNSKEVNGSEVLTRKDGSLIQVDLSYSPLSVNDAPSDTVVRFTATNDALSTQADVKKPADFLIKCGPAHDQNGELLGTIEMLRDGTEHKLFEQRLEDDKHKAEIEAGMSELDSNSLPNIESNEKLPGILDLKPILLVEDDPINQRVAGEMLNRLNIPFNVANNGIEALEKWKSEQHSLIFMDCSMPEMDGYQATRIIRENEKTERIPIIALTTNAIKSNRDRCFKAGMDDFVSKPFKKTTLSEVIEKWAVRQYRTVKGSESPDDNPPNSTNGRFETITAQPV